MSQTTYLVLALNKFSALALLAFFCSLFACIQGERARRQNTSGLQRLEQAVADLLTRIELVDVNVPASGVHVGDLERLQAPRTPCVAKQNQKRVCRDAGDGKHGSPCAISKSGRVLDTGFWHRIPQRAVSNQSSYSTDLNYCVDHGTQTDTQADDQQAYAHVTVNTPHQTPESSDSHKRLITASHTRLGQRKISRQNIMRYQRLFQDLKHVSLASLQADSRHNSSFKFPANSSSEQSVTTNDIAHRVTGVRYSDQANRVLHWKDASPQMSATDASSMTAGFVPSGQVAHPSSRVDGTANRGNRAPSQTDESMPHMSRTMSQADQQSPQEEGYTQRTINDSPTMVAPHPKVKPEFHLPTPLRNLEQEICILNALALILQSTLPGHGPAQIDHIILSFQTQLQNSQQLNTADTNILTEVLEYRAGAHLLENLYSVLLQTVPLVHQEHIPTIIAEFRNAYRAMWAVPGTNTLAEEEACNRSANGVEPSKNGMNVVTASTNDTHTPVLNERPNLIHSRSDFHGPHDVLSAYYTYFDPCNDFPSNEARQDSLSGSTSASSTHARASSSNISSPVSISSVFSDRSLIHTPNLSDSSLVDLAVGGEAEDLSLSGSTLVPSGSSTPSLVGQDDALFLEFNSRRGLSTRGEEVVQGLEAELRDRSRAGWEDVRHERRDGEPRIQRDADAIVTDTNWADGLTLLERLGPIVELGLSVDISDASEGEDDL